MTLYFIYILIITRYLRGLLKKTEYNEKWNRPLLMVMYGALALWILSVIAKGHLETLLVWVGEIVLAGLAWLLYSQPEFKNAKLLLNAILPFIAIAFLSHLTELINKSFYNKWQGMLDTATVFAVLWSIGVWLVIRKQNKELNEAKQKALREEQNSKVISAMNDQLEVQVRERTAELTRQKEELEHALEELKSTQSQLIQSEKMASLGELTAGIAHEIQNPLNFVNNFSEVSAELLVEMKEEMSKGNTAEVELIASDLQQNLVKIAQHGKRADGIVKSMLQHSRKNTGQLEATSINALADEYLRLSYHGLRAKDKSFNADYKTDFDESIGKVNVVPQDVGRVLLNLFNNAFYAVSEKKKMSDASYQPTVWVSTKKQADEIVITIKDNGNGIPQQVIDKIFQPFFTTKPTGQGTGLGLSLSYDIITKQHKGTIKVESEENKFTKFIITIPL